MAYKQLYIFVEGSDDEFFVANVVIPLLKPKYDLIKIWEYQQKPNKKTQNFLKAIISMGADYFFLADINSSPCKVSKKDKLQHEYGHDLDLTKAVIVVKEIESWYLAGLDETASSELKIKYLPKTNDVTKEKFESLMPSGFSLRIDFMMEVLKRFSIDQARNKNESFDYFMSKAS